MRTKLERLLLAAVLGLSGIGLPGMILAPFCGILSFEVAFMPAPFREIQVRVAHARLGMSSTAIGRWTGRRD